MTFTRRPSSKTPWFAGLQILHQAEGDHFRGVRPSGERFGRRTPRRPEDSATGSTVRTEATLTLNPVGLASFAQPSNVPVLHDSEGLGSSSRMSLVPLDMVMDYCSAVV